MLIIAPYRSWKVEEHEVEWSQTYSFKILKVGGLYNLDRYTMGYDVNELAHYHRCIFLEL